MERFLALALLPVVLSALEKVNLIKDAGFERGSSEWLIHKESTSGVDSLIINRHDPDSSFIGNYCGSIDARTPPYPDPPNLHYTIGELYQLFEYPKELQDLDSLLFYHMCLFQEEGGKFTTISYDVLITLFNPSDSTRFEVWFKWHGPDIVPSEDTPYEKIFPDTIRDEGLWDTLRSSLYDDLVEEKGLSPTIKMDTFILTTYGIGYYGWRGQKAFFDGVRLTGWADYDIALTRLSGSLFVPAAMVWNNGREDQTDVMVICNIEGDRPEPYADTVILPSLASDDSVEVTFAENEYVSGSSDYLLTVVTGGEVGMLDECDEDDILTEFYPSAVSEPEPVTHHEGLDLEVINSPGGVLKVLFKTPERQIGNLTIYDSSGRLVERNQVKGSGRMTIDHLPAGLYFVRLESPQGSVTSKAIILN